MKLTLPYPPSINHYYCRKRDGNLYIGKRGKEYRLATKLALIQSKHITINGAVSITVHLICPDYRRRDLDNPIKCLSDALVKAGAIQDDSFIVELSVIKHKPDSSNKAGQAIVYIDRAAVDSVETNNSGGWIV